MDASTGPNPRVVGIVHLSNIVSYRVAAIKHSPKYPYIMPKSLLIAHDLTLASVFCM